MFITKDVLTGLVRHLFTTFGGYLVTMGYLADTDEVTMVGGAIAVIVGVVWSVMAKKNA